MIVETTKKRRWFQVQLSTAVVLMVVSGGFLGINFWPRRMAFPFKSAGPYHPSHVFRTVRGWPCPAHVEYILGPQIVRAGVRLGNVLVNVLVAISILAATALVCEWHLRRLDRERRKGEG